MNSSKHLLFTIALCTYLLISGGCKESKSSVDMPSTMTIDGLSITFSEGVRGKYTITGGEPLLFEWHGPAGIMKIEGRRVYLNEKFIGDATNAKYVAVDKNGKISIIEE